MSNDNCGMREVNPAVRTVSAQTIPGSLDTKFFDVGMCEKCAESYYELLDAVTPKRRRVAQAHVKDNAVQPAAVDTLTYDPELFHFIQERR